MKFITSFFVSQIVTHFFIALAVTLLDNISGTKIGQAMYPELIIPVAIGGLIGTIVTAIEEKKHD